MVMPPLGGLKQHPCLAILTAWLIAAAGCQSDSTNPNHRDSDAAVDAHTADASGDASGDADSAYPDADPDSGTDAEDPTCIDGLPATPFFDGAATVAYDAPAPDFTVNTTSGEWTLSEHWNGCDNYVFVMFHPGYKERAEQFWSSDVKELVDDSAPNTHYFFVTLENGLSTVQRQARVMEVGERIDSYLSIKDEAIRKHWMERFHYVTDYGRDLPLIDGILASSYGEVHFTVDRKQLVREGHNTAYYTYQGWRMQLRNTRYWAKYYNAQYLLDSELAKQARETDVLVHRVTQDEDIAGSVPFLWRLPDAATISQYEKLEIDMRVGCPGAGHPYGSTCGEWDTVGSIWLCGDETCTDINRRRLVKWITPYSAPGRWVIDITPELVALADGGQMRFMVQHGDNDVGPYTYKYTVDFRFSKSADGLKPFALATLVPCGNYSFATMADAFDPFVVQAPPGTVKAELYARISGHGSEEVSGCAEFCTFEHAFNVNGIDHQHVYRMDHADRCAERVEQGVTPNQGGTWHFDRSSWCPGWTIEEWREDLTDSFVLDGTNTIEHVPTFQGGTPPGGNMDARVELVYYR